MDGLLPIATSHDERERASRIAVLPVGSFEQHGPQLPLITDTVVACTLAAEIAAAHNLRLLPPITVSCSHEHGGFPGTVSISARTLHSLVTDIATSAAASGSDRLLIVNGHGGNYVLSNVVLEANVSGPRMALFPSRYDWEQARQTAALETSSHDDMHGGELEVSILLHAYPELVGTGAGDQDHDAPHRPLLLTLGMCAYTTSGIVGSPSKATAQKGKAIVEALVELAGAHLAALA